MRRIVAVAGVCFALGVIAMLWLQRDAALPRTDAPAAVAAVLLQGLGDHRMEITVAGAEARRWFDQGLILAYGFNHDAALRAFLKAASLDADCAMCWWGAALVLGPHLNAAMDPANHDVAWKHLQRARHLAPQVTEREQGFIGALSRRYSEPPPADRGALDEAYAQAMRKLAAKYPKDPDAAALLAEALMDLHPWDFHDRGGVARPWTAEIVAILEKLLLQDPRHPGANHLYIHAVEASAAPERALPAARMLDALVPGAGHLVHMSSHIYMRTGHYHKASESNRRAIAADQQFLSLCSAASGGYPQGYVPHNHHFLYASSMMEGNGAQALAAALEVANRMDLQRSRQPGYEAIQHYWVAPYFARVRFGRWTEILAEPPPPADLPYPTAMWHYVRGMALVRQGRLDDAPIELSGLATIAAHPDMERASVWGLNSFASVLRVAERVLAGELAAARKDHRGAVKLLEEAVALEAQFNYDEPAPWYFPVRQSLGAVLLEAGRAEAAQNVYEEDLRRNRENGWSLFGLVIALEAQRRPSEEARSRLRAAWKHADVTLNASRF